MEPSTVSAEDDAFGGTIENSSDNESDSSTHTAVTAKSTAASEPGSSGSAQQKGPKAKRHVVWEHFSSDGKNVADASCKTCKKVLHNATTTNMKKHLEYRHKEQYRKVIQMEKENKSSKMGSHEKAKGGTLEGYFSKKEQYSKTSKRKIEIDSAFAGFAAMPTISLNVLVSQQFQKLVHTLDPKYPLPKSRGTIITLFQLPLEKIKKKITELLDSCEQISLSLDIWSQRGMVRSYMAITAHFYSDVSKNLERVLLGISEIRGRHTAETVFAEFQRTIDKWNISDDKIVRIVTDNGSNVIAAFREAAITIQGEIDNTGDMSAMVATGNYNSVDVNLEEEEDDDEDWEVTQDTDDFEKLEQEFSVTFKKRISCVAHTLQLVLHSTVEKQMHINEAIQHMLHVLKKFKKSVKATESLIAKCGKTVLLPAKTRWNSLYIVLERVIEIEEHINQVCLEQRWTPLSSCLNVLEALKNLLKPFFDQTNFLQAETYATISSVYPSLKFLLSTLDLEGETATLLSPLQEHIKVELERRFQHVLNLNSEKFDATYAMATLLDPNVAWLVDDAVKFVAKRQMLHLVRPQNDEVQSEGAKEEEAQPAASKTASHYGAFALAVAEKKRRLNIEQKKADNQATICDKYLHEFADQPPSQDVEPLEFWRINSHEYPNLAKLAFALLPIPATSAPVERVFSQAGLCSMDRKNRIGPELLELKCMIQMNSHILNK